MIHLCAVRLSRLGFKVKHVNGKRNVYADMLTTWAKGYTLQSRCAKETVQLVDIIDGKMEGP